MSDTTHDIAGLIDQMAQAIDAVRPGGVLSSNSKLSAALFALYEAMPTLTALQAERDAAISKVDFYEQKDGMGGAVVHAIREILYAHNVPKAAFIDDHVTNAIVQRDAWKARAEAAEAALNRAYERGRDDAGDVVSVADLGWHDGISGDWHPLSAKDALLAALTEINALTPPADLAKGVADE